MNTGGNYEAEKSDNIGGSVRVIEIAFISSINNDLIPAIKLRADFGVAVDRAFLIGTL
jgi:hypothetical protein